MSGNKNFKKRRREEEMDEREQKRRRSDQDRDRSRSYHNSRSADQDRPYKNINNGNKYGQNHTNRRKASNNYADRNNNAAHAPKNNNRPHYRIKETPDNNRNFEKKPKKISIHFTNNSQAPKATSRETLHFNFDNISINNQTQVSPSPPKPKVSNTPAPTNTPAAPAPPLPGYYFDPDVNRYFKLPPSGTVMYKKYQEVLKKAAEKERKQQEETKEREEQERLDRGVNISILSHRYKSPLSAIVRREAGRSQSKEFMSKSIGTLFKRIERRYTFPWPLGDTECYDMIAVGNGERLVTGLRDGQLMVDELEWKDNDIHVNGLCTTESSSISSVGYSSKYDIPVYSATILGGGRSGELKLYTSQLHAKHSTKLRKGSMWCHEWSPNDQYISMGVSKGAMVLDNTTMRTVACFTEKSDVFAQAFTEDSNILLNGSRDGKIRTFDIRKSWQRTPFGSHAPIMKHESSITCLKVLKDDNYIVANSINGVVNVWDRRMSKVVTRMEYPNQMTSTKFSVDPNEEFVFIGGDDKKVYIWNLKSGELIHTLGPYAIPIKSLVFGRSWLQDRVRVPGFWTFLNTSIEFYGICDVNM